jgi:hypothetical protein
METSGGNRAQEEENLNRNQVQYLSWLTWVFVYSCNLPFILCVSLNLISQVTILTDLSFGFHGISF